MKTFFYCKSLIVVVFCISCSQNAYLNDKNFSDEYGRIRISVSSKEHPDSVTFYGKFEDIETGKVPPASAVIIIDSTAHLLTKEGTYSITLKYKESFKLTSLTFPYFSLTTGEVKVKKGKVYKVDFYLKEDTNPLID